VARQVGRFGVAARAQPLRAAGPQCERRATHQYAVKSRQRAKPRQCQPRHPPVAAEEALDLLPDAQLRMLPQTGYLAAYDDPVGVAREISAFCG
jgi:hypothetical protein